MVFRFLIIIPLAFSLFTLPSWANKSTSSAKTALARAALPSGSSIDYGQPPKVSKRSLRKETQIALEDLTDAIKHATWGVEQSKSLILIAESRDPRLAWIITDMMRFIGNAEIISELNLAVSVLLEKDFKGFNIWNTAVNHLIAWDIPAPPNYLYYKRKVFTAVLPEWEPLFDKGPIDWRHVSWGGVRIDNRPFGTTDEPCHCIPAADNPEVTSASNAHWLDDEDIIFGLSINGEQRAYPRQIMEVREMVNDTLGGRDIGLPYCTLCASAQAWFTDDLPEGVERPILRTSGLLIRSNKVMYDLTTHSIFNTFKGNAVTGNLAQKGIQLKQASIVTTTWGEWKKTYPETTVLVEKLALGRNFDFRNGRDADGPIFPIGDYDPRLSAQEDILGVVTKDGQAIAFHVPSLMTALDDGKKVSVGDIRVELNAGGLKALDQNNEDMGSHQAFWFAWSQFYPSTKLWPLDE